jgi:hypothetical protein
MEKTKPYTEKIIDRLEEYVKSRGDKFTRLSIELGISSGYFSRMKKIRGGIGSEILARILIYYNDLSADWLLTGHGQMLKGSQPIKYTQTYAQREKTLKSIDSTIATMQRTIETLQAQKSALDRLLH